VDVICEHWFPDWEINDLHALGTWRAMLMPCCEWVEKTAVGMGVWVVRFCHAYFGGVGKEARFHVRIPFL
jgi:hypothetical protein